MNTCTKLKLDNKAISKIKVDELDFSYVNKEGQIKFKDRLHVPFLVPPKSILKGLKLRIYKDTGHKIFVLSIWFNKQSQYYSVGKFSDNFGITEVEDKLHPIVRSHTNDKGHWLKNPKTTEAEAERVLQKQDIKDIDKIWGGSWGLPNTPV